MSHVTHLRSVILKVMLVPFVVTILMVSGYYSVVKIGEDDDRYSVSQIATTAKVTAYDIRYWSGRNAGSGYSLGELDTQLRAGHLDISTALPIWEREVTGVIEKQWGTSWKRFAAVLIMGGGAILLKDNLPYAFNGKAYLPDEPVQAIARGLYRLILLQQTRKGK